MAIQGTSGRMLGLVLSLAAFGASADVAPPMVFRHLTVDEGLAENTVMATLQDSRGFMWFATEQGLDRYDGYRLQHFSHTDTAGLAGNYVWSIKEDPSGKLWFALKDRGVARFDPRTETITSYRHDTGNAASLSSDSARNLLIDRRGQVWIATTGGGVNILDPATGRVRRLLHDPERADSLSSDDVIALAEDRDGRIWVGTDGGGLDSWAPSGHGFEHYAHDDGNPRSLPSNRISTLYVDAAGTLWLGTFDQGLARFDASQRSFAAFRAEPRDLERLSNPEIRSMLEDSEHRFWVATAGGLNLMERGTGRFTRFQHDATDPGSLRVDYVMSLFQDRSGLLWVGTLGGGVSRWNPRGWRFGHTRPPWLANAYAIAFADDAGNRIWVGTQGGGLYRYDTRSGAVETANTAFATSHLLPDSSVMALLHARTGDLWVGTMKGGLIRITPLGHTRRFDNTASTRRLGANGVMSLCEARDGRVWAGTFGGGIAIIDPATEHVEHIDTDPRRDGSGPDAPVTAIAQGLDGIVWVGTDGGGLLALHEDGSFAGTWRHRETDPASLAAETLYALHVDAQGRIWAGTDSAGLIEVLGSASTPQSVRFRNMTLRDGLSSDTVYGIEEDGRGGLWLSGTRGLVRYTPTTGDLRLFHRDDGLQGEEFNFAAHFRLRNGDLVFAGANGFNLFDPQRVLDVPPAAPPIALTAIDLKGRPARAGMPFAFLPELTMGYRDDVASFEFAALDYTAPEKNRFSYRLLGFDDHWSTPDTARRAIYTNLDAGQYVFEVRGVSAEGAWGLQPLHLPITVAPAPWRSTPAYAAYAALALLLVWSYLATQRRQLRLAAEQAADLESQVDLRTEELRASNVELQRLTRAKSDFLARMSHEIRTPMNGIIGMGEMLMRTHLTDNQVRLARTVHRSAKSLMQILNDILDLAKVEAGRLTIISEPFDLTSVMMETAELFAAQAEDKQIELIVAPSPDLQRPLLGDPMRTRQILMNLVGNAVKFTAHGEISIVADVIDGPGDGKRLSLAVRDSGIGMPSDVVATIFEPFTQGDESTTRQFGGTGLGLTICRELVELMGGSILAASELQVGSTFTVILPLSLADATPARPQADVEGALVVTRRASLADAVLRQFALLGVACRWIDPARDTALTQVVTVRRETVVIDVESCAGELPWFIGECLDPGFAECCVFLGSATALANLDLTRQAPGVKFLPKPLGPQTLSRLLSPPEVLLEDSAPSRPRELVRLQGRVLIVEDNPVNAAVFEGLLEEIGCTGVTAATGREAVAVAEVQRFDAVLMDIHMPDMDGWATTRLIREAEGSGRRTPIIALTADAATANRRLCLEADMDDFLTKPLALADLLAVLTRWLPRAAAAESDKATTLSLKTLSRINELDRTGRGGFLGRITTLFIDTSARQTGLILDAVAKGELTTVVTQCHSLKSAAGHVGADALAQLLMEIERAAKADDAIRVGILVGGLRAARNAAASALQGEFERLRA